MSSRRISLAISFAGVVAFAAALSGCLPPIVDSAADDGDSDGQPSLIDVHLYKYDTATGEYVLGSKRISQAEVDRDLSGALCGKCHAEQVDDVLDSVHYKWTSRNDNVLFPGGGAHGMLDRACGLPASSALVNFKADIQLDECGNCHVGRYMPVMETAFAGMFGQMGLPDPQGQARQIVESGVDCLICHAEKYRSVPENSAHMQVAATAPPDGESPTPIGFARAARDNSDFDGDGQPDPQIDTDGDGVADMPLMQDRDGDGQPETPWPTVAQDRSFEAVASVGLTTDEACLRCHEHARTGYKRGTLYREGYDVHATSDAVAALGGGEHRRCVGCHKASHHKFRRGNLVGGDLMASDYAVGTPENDLTCQSCHDPAQLQGLYHESIHTNVLACETCHIPYTSGITYALWGHGSNLTFGRNEAGQDTKFITLDHYIDGRTDEDVDADWGAYRTYPTLSWFNGNVSFLAQSLAVRGTPGAKITPFKPMANGLVFDARFFNGMMAGNAAMDGAYQYNAYSMYRFMAGGANADIFTALDFSDLTPDEARGITLNDFFSTDPDRQAMALMQIFPNMVLFEKGTYGYVRYLTGVGSPWDADGDGVIDMGADYNFDMLAAANAGLRAFQGFNAPMGMPADYEWYPPYETTDDVISMKVPDGTLIKMFLGMQGMNLPAEQQPDFFNAIADYPAFSNGVTLGGHGVRPKEQALGYGESCGVCHDEGGIMDHRVPVTETVTRDVPGLGQLQFPLYRWHYYDIHKLTDLGLATNDEDVVAGVADVDIAGDATYTRESANTIVVNYMNPAGEGSYRPADHADSLAGTDLAASDLTTNGGSWMAVLEPVVRYVPNYRVLGFTRDEILFLDN